MEELIGATGTLFLDSDGRVHRKLAWAQFVDGAPEPLPEIDGMQQRIEEQGVDGNEPGEWREMSLDP